MKNIISTIITVLIASTAAQAQKDDRSSDKVDLKKLEDKYWSAKDDDYGVIQNRTFAKTGKFYVSGVYGTLINDPYATAKPYGGMLGYYFTEDFGVEASYLIYTSGKNENVQKLNNISFSVSPNYNLIRNNMSLSLTYTPFYAKMAFMNKAIMYFDMGFTLGAGMTTYDQVQASVLGQESFTSKSAPHIEVGVMQQLFISKNIAVRMDLKNTFYSQEIVPYQVNSNTTSGKENKSTNDTTLVVGVTLFSN